jgi:ferredoxin-NADP reductase
MATTTSATRGANSGTKVTDRRAPAGGWRQGIVRSITHPTPRGVVVRLDVADRVEHWAGQHYVIRLTAEDGYTAQRSYSIASPPSDAMIELYVERLEDGEVSTFVADALEVGDSLNIRGPIGGWFVWQGDTPAVGVAGGSGVVPLVAMLRHGVSLGTADLLRLAVSSRTLADLPYAQELLAAGTVIALTREDAASGRAAGRLTAAELQPLLVPDATGFVCGSESFAEAASELLMEIGMPTERIRVERFGPSG